MLSPLSPPRLRGEPSETPRVLRAKYFHAELATEVPQRLMQISRSLRFDDILVARQSRRESAVARSQLSLHQDSVNPAPKFEAHRTKGPNEAEP
jgi:hypothetical protein